MRTASKDVLVAYFKSTVVNANEVNTADPASWRLNGQPVTAINKFVTEADACDHHIYLQVPTLVNGTAYTLQTPHGERTFVFDDRATFCESIKPHPCHTTIWQVNGPIAEARLVVTGSEPSFTAYGGYHDAGDADLRMLFAEVSICQFVHKAS